MSQNRPDLLQGKIPPAQGSLERAYRTRFIELQRQNELLRRANKEKDHLLAVCAHDIRAPLHIILGNIQLLLSERGLNDDMRSMLNTAERQAKRLLELMTALIERGRDKFITINPQREAVDLSTLVADVVEDFKALAKTRNITIRHHRCSASTHYWVRGDSSALRQVIENLLANGISHGKRGDCLETQVSYHDVSKQVRVEVRDNGPGIEPTLLPQIFERYRKNGNGVGVGLGLAICRDIIDAHGGEIWAESQLNHGALFIFTLNRINRPCHGSPTSTPPSPANPRSTA